MASGTVVHIFAPDGTPGTVPFDQMNAAIKAGGVPAVQMKAPDGTLGYIPANRVQDAQKAGGTIIPDSTTSNPQSDRPGFWSTAGTLLKNQAVGALQMSLATDKGIRDMYLASRAAGHGPLTSALMSVAGVEKPEVDKALNAVAQWENEKQSGRSLLYRIAAQAGSSVGVDVPSMERATAEGNSRAVLAGAAVPAAEAAAGYGAAEGLSALRGTKAAPSASAEVGNAPADVNVRSVGAASSTPEAVSAEQAKGAVGKFAQTLGIADGPPEDLLTRAIKPKSSNTGWNLDIRKAIPDLKASEADMGHPIQSASDVVEAASIAKKKIWAEYSAKLKQASQRTNAETPDAMASETPFAGGGGATIDGNKVADAMMNSIDARTQLQNPALVEKIKGIADTYRRPMSLDEAEDFLQSANNDLHSYYAKNKVGQQVAARDPETGHVVAEANALRDALYSKIDEVTGPGAADLKRRYGALSNVQDEAMRRVNVAARQNPQSLAEQLSMARAYGKIAVGILRGSPSSLLEGTESLAASKWLKERGTTDAMITRAFAKMGAPGIVAATARTGPGFTVAIPLTIHAPQQQPNEVTQ